MVRSIGVDPFKMVDFMEQEFGKVTMQNRVMNPYLERLVKDAIEYQTDGNYAVSERGMVMRQDSIHVDGKKEFELFFVTGVVPDTFTIKQTALNAWPTVIFLPVEDCKGAFIILEDAIGFSFNQLYSVFDEDLNMEREPPIQLFSSSLLVNGLHSTEDLHILFQHYSVIGNLRLLYSYLYTRLYQERFYANSLEPVAIGNQSFFKSMEVHIWKIVKSEINNSYCFIEFPRLLTYVALRRILKSIYPGFVDDKESFNRKVTRRLIAQDLAMSTIIFNRALDQESIKRKKRTNFDGIAEVVDTIIRIMDFIDQPEFASLRIERKYLEYHKFIKQIEKEAPSKEEQLHAYRETNGEDEA